MVVPCGSWIILMMLGRCRGFGSVVCKYMEQGMILAETGMIIAETGMIIGKTGIIITETGMIISSSGMISSKFQKNRLLNGLHSLNSNNFSSKKPEFITIS